MVRQHVLFHLLAPGGPMPIRRFAEKIVHLRERVSVGTVKVLRRQMSLPVLRGNCQLILFSMPRVPEYRFNDSMLLLVFRLTFEF